MAYANSGGVRLSYEEIGQGTPILFVHEMGSDIRQWEQQLRWFGQRFRCIAYNARGYVPSDVPPDDVDYTYDKFVGDIGAVLDHCGVDRAHLVGWSMGAYASLVFGLKHPGRCLSITATGVGSGSPRHEHAHFGEMMVGLNRLYVEKGAAHCADLLANGTTRVQLKRKDIREWERFRANLAEHSAEGMARTCLNFQGKRPSLDDFEAEFKTLRVPVLLVCGDEDFDLRRDQHLPQAHHPRLWPVDDPADRPRPQPRRSCRLQSRRRRLHRRRRPWRVGSKKLSHAAARSDEGPTSPCPIIPIRSAATVSAATSPSR